MFWKLFYDWKYIEKSNHSQCLGLCVNLVTKVANELFWKVSMCGHRNATFSNWDPSVLQGCSLACWVRAMDAHHSVAHQSYRYATLQPSHGNEILRLVMFSYHAGDTLKKQVTKRNNSSCCRNTSGQKETWSTLTILPVLQLLAMLVACKQLLWLAGLIGRCILVKNANVKNASSCIDQKPVAHKSAQASSDVFTDAT